MALRFSGRRPGALVLLAAALPLALPGRAAAQQASAPGLRGRVVAADDGRPLASAAVVLGEGAAARTVVTDSAGRFLAEGLAPGPLTLEVRYLGFASRTARVLIPEDDTLLDVTLRLETRPVPLPALSVRVGRPAETRMGKLAGFRERRARGLGHFLDREDIEKTPGSRLGEVFRRVLNVKVVQCGLGGFCETLSFRRTFSYGVNGGCQPMIFLDGTRYRLDPNVGINEIPKHDITAIEVYTGPAEIPSMYKGPGAGCGVVLLWTRTGEEAAHGG